MNGLRLGYKKIVRWCAPFVALVVMAASAQAATPGLTFNSSFQSGLSSFTSTGGGAQCANYHTPSTAPRLRGNFFDVMNGGVQAGRFDLPASQPGYPLQACELTHQVSTGLNTDSYYGYMFYVPLGWQTGGVQPSDFWGISVAQFHFQNIWGSPINFELHNDHVTLAMQTGACNSHLTTSPGCQNRSNADNPNGLAGNIGGQYAIPAPMAQGVWQELVMHVHWATDSRGQVEVWHRIQGTPAWTQTVNVSGYPTVQWLQGSAGPGPKAIDKIGAYRGLATTPVSVFEANFLIGSSFATVAANLP